MTIDDELKPERIKQCKIQLFKYLIKEEENIHMSNDNINLLAFLYNDAEIRYYIHEKLGE